jgi:hypothetical protein
LALVKQEVHATLLLKKKSRASRGRPGLLVPCAGCMARKRMLLALLSLCCVLLYTHACNCLLVILLKLAQYPYVAMG